MNVIGLPPCIIPPWYLGLYFCVFSVVPDEAIELANPVVLLSGFSPLEV
jgi:hypothetical protein